MEIHEEQGQGLVIVTIMLLMLLTLTGLVIDGGFMFVYRRYVQNAADAGALAGAWELTQGSIDSQIYSRIQEYTVISNHATSFTATYQPDGTAVGSGSIPAGTNAVRVEAEFAYQTVFAGIIGVNEVTVRAQAAAGFGTVAEMTAGVYPIAVEWEEFQFDETYNIFAGGGPGNFGWLGWTGCTNTPCLCTSLTPPGDSETYVNPNDSSDHTLSLGDWVEGSTGKKNAACVRNALDSFIANATPITIVVWDQAQGTGANLDYRIAGFAKFIVEDYNLPQNRITGRFIHMVTSGAGTQSGTGYGLYGIGITE